MLQISCPYCGPRDEVEFVSGGPAYVVRPPLTADDATWTDYWFNQDNPKGEFIERWCHLFGCERWFNTVRNTITHEMSAGRRQNESIAKRGGPP